MLTLPEGLHSVELRSNCYLMSKEFSPYSRIEIQPLEELHSMMVLLPVDKIANFSEAFVWVDNPSLTDISRDWHFKILELDQHSRFETWMGVISSSVLGMLVLFCCLSLCLDVFGGDLRPIQTPQI